MNPYVQGNLTKLKLTMPAQAERVWQLIATPSGLSRWFPRECRGKIAMGETVEFHWSSGSPEKFQVLELQPNHSWLMNWVEGGTVRYSIQGENPVIIALEVSYPQTQAGKEAQELEVAPWSFLIANLKSVALDGPDLRSHNPAYTWKDSFLD